MPYEFLDDVAVADIAFEAWGRDLKETFLAAADATMNVMVEELGSIRPVERKEFHLQNEALDLLLLEFLQELIYYKDAEELLLRVKEVELQENGKSYSLRATASGEKIDPARHPLGVDVKAVTLHRFRLERVSRGWEAFVILDI
jgi:SHS2 domain-containing protein